MSKFLTLRQDSFPNFDARFFDSRELAEAYVSHAMGNGFGTHDLYALVGTYAHPIEFTPADPPAPPVGTSEDAEG